MALPIKNRITKPKIGEKAEKAAGEHDTVGGTDAIAGKRLYPDVRTEFEHLRSSLKIDRNALDDNMIEQPVLYQEVSEAHVMAVSERDAAKEKLAAVDARLAHEIRVKWNNAGEKFSEVKVGDAVQLEPEHIVHYDDWAHKSRRAAYLGALKDSFDQRSKMLRELGSLYVTGYFDRAVSNAGARDTSAGMAARARESMNRQRRERE